MVLKTPVVWAVVHAKTSVCAFRSSCNFSLVFVCSYLPMVIVYSGYWSFTTIFSSASKQLRISSLSAFRASLAILCYSCRLFSERRGANSFWRMKLYSPMDSEYYDLDLLHGGPSK
ncbi:hypothetical protein Tco_1395231 [Tanacetum coccineum]